MDSEFVIKTERCNSIKVEKEYKDKKIAKNTPFIFKILMVI